MGPETLNELPKVIVLHLLNLQRCSKPMGEAGG